MGWPRLPLSLPLSVFWRTGILLTLTMTTSSSKSQVQVLDGAAPQASGHSQYPPSPHPTLGLGRVGEEGPPDLEELSFCHQTGKNLSRQQKLGRREFGLEDKYIRNSLRKRKETCHDRRSTQISPLLITQRKSQNTQIQPPSLNPSTFTLCQVAGRLWGTIIRACLGGAPCQVAEAEEKDYNGR